MPFSDQLGYAETHYKFKLPWSPLSRPWPELIIDAPFQVVSDQSLRLWIIVKDAHLFPCHLVLVNAHFTSSLGHSQTCTLGQEFACCETFHFFPVDFDLPSEGALYQIWVEAMLVKPNGAKRIFWTHNLPGLEAQPLLVHRLNSPLPIPQGWVSGDTHVHSYATSDQVEFGASPIVYQDMARQIGLDFVCLTDHSYDMEWDSRAYMNPVNGQNKFDLHRAEALSLNGPGRPVMIWGEEVSCGNSRGENVHLLVMGHQKFIKGQGDGGRRWLNNRPDFSISEVLDLAQGSPCLAAHPGAGVGLMEKLIFRRGIWSSEDLRKGLHGLQFASGSWNRATAMGEELWRQALLADKSFLPIGGSDAHGDFNANYGMSIPLFKLKSSRSFLFGKMRTLLPVGADDVKILNALKSDVSVATNGPWIGVTFVGKRLVVQLMSNADFGGLATLKVHWLLNHGFVEQECVVGGYQEEIFFDPPLGVRSVYVICIDKQGCKAVSSSIKLG